MTKTILGYGLSGKAAGRFLGEKGETCHVYDDRKEALENLPDHIDLLEKPELPEDCDELIVSPGVPWTHPLIQDALTKTISVAGEIELAGRYVTSEKVIAVTGTNGKSTTVSLIARLLEQAGYKCGLCGNIGMPMVEYVGKGYDFLVVEISSFQLETLKSLAPDVSAILNVTPDHLDRYESYEHYLMTKTRLAHLTKPDGVVVINGGDDALSAALSHLDRPLKIFSSHGRSDIFFDGSSIHHLSVELESDKLSLKGFHNIENIMAALLCSEKYIDNVDIFRDVFYSFKGLSHRMEHVADIKNVHYYDDSKGTNVGAVEKSLAGFEDGTVVLIMGGVDKGGSYEPVVELAATKCRHAILIGQAGPVIARALDGHVPFTHASSMEEAVAIAFLKSSPGDSVLLSPACSSYDMYKNFKERGDDFQARVMSLKQREEACQKV